MNDFAWGFDPLFPLWIILVISFAAFGLFLWLELKRKQRFLIYRIVALVFILISILGLLMRPSFKSERKNETILLTPGFDKSKVDSVIKLNSHLKIIRTALSESYPNSHVAQTYQSLADENIKYIFGEGLPEFALDLLHGSGFIFLPCETPKGVIELNVPKIFANRRNSISGIFNASQKTKLKLTGPGGVEDSVTIGEGKHSFTLSLRPKQSGLFLYNLISEDSFGKNFSERLPIEVEQQRRLRILFLQNFPSAEIRYLKNFLTEKGHFIGFRTLTSKNNFSEEFVNMPRVQLNQLSTELLDSFDLVMADSRTMDGLSKTQKLILEKSVFSGLGLIVSQDFKSQKTEFYSIKGRAIANDTVHLLFADKKYVMSSLPYDVADDPSLESVLKTKRRVLTGYQFHGAGKIGFQLLQETFHLQLEGNHDDYALIWSTLLEKVARRQEVKFQSKMDSCFPYYTYEPVGISIISSGEKPAVYSDEFRIPLTEDMLIDDYWHSKAWAAKPGWHQLEVSDSTALNYFVHEPTEWKSLRAANSSNQTRLAQKENVLLNTAYQKVVTRVSALLLYLIFLLSSGFLWLAPKI